QFVRQGARHRAHRARHARWKRHLRRVRRHPPCGEPRGGEHLRRYARHPRADPRPRHHRHPGLQLGTMALLQLNEAQVRAWTREQKDKWWLDNVFRGGMPQLTLRSAATGFLLGGVLAATALYIAARTGITIGVGLTSVILAF